MTPAARTSKPRTAKAAAPKALDLRQNPHLYQINTWLWLDSLSAAAGKRIKLGTVPDAEWDRVASWGIDLVYLLGIWQRSRAGRRIARQQPDLVQGYDAALPGWTLDDVVGSPFSIGANAPDPRIGTWKDIDTAREKLRARGIGLILDFVPNHTGPDHPWITEHPEYYVQGTLADMRRDPLSFHLIEQGDETLIIAQGRDPHFLPWHDTAQLNYFRPELRAAMIEFIRTISEHCDGIRCDMAMLVLNSVFADTWKNLLHDDVVPATEFWAEVHSALPAHISIAEVYWDLETKLQELGLTYSYDKVFYDRLRFSPADDLRRYLHMDLAQQHRLVRFLENHDEARSAEAFPPNKLRAAATMQALLPGLRFYQAGQFEGKRIRPPAQLARVAPELPDVALEDFYRRLMSMANEPIFHAGQWQLLDVLGDFGAGTDNLIAWQWKLGDDLCLIVVNLADAVSHGCVICRDAGEREVALIDPLNNEEYVRDTKTWASQGLYVRLEPYRTHVFTVKPASAARSAASGK